VLEREFKGLRGGDSPEGKPSPSKLLTGISIPDFEKMQFINV